MEERLFQFIKDTVYKVTGKKGLFYDTDFVKDLELTSFDVMNIVCIFEDHFDVDIPSRDVWKLHQVKDVIAYMIRKGITNV
ncbi:MAG: acyl carrier protein [Ruminococcaceae bacterium]|nr:acyl carrier protein [Oscillospiraceae bacterium]MBO4971271.1 acyl carrier protein [Clostridia bacterium]MBQ1259442.1 acyl carrier protein [Clostridia bacterium]